VASRRARSRPLLLLWSPDGSRLLGVGRDTIDVRTAALALVQAQVLQHGTIAAAAWAPRGRRYAFVVHDARRDRSAVVVQGEAETPFQGTGRVDGLVWSPDGRWLLLAWRTADEWVFAPAGGGERIRAVGSISAQFHSASFPRLAGWCC
jgi:Tol biopolymer transport system component